MSIPITIKNPTTPSTTASQSTSEKNVTGLLPNGQSIDKIENTLHHFRENETQDSLSHQMVGSTDYGSNFSDRDLIGCESLAGDYPEDWTSENSQALEIIKKDFFRDIYRDMEYKEIKEDKAKDLFKKFSNVTSPGNIVPTLLTILEKNNDRSIKNNKLNAQAEIYLIKESFLLLNQPENRHSKETYERILQLEKLYKRNLKSRSLINYMRSDEQKLGKDLKDTIECMHLKQKICKDTELPHLEKIEQAIAQSKLSLTEEVDRKLQFLNHLQPLASHPSEDAILYDCHRDLTDNVEQLINHVDFPFEEKLSYFKKIPTDYIDINRKRLIESDINTHKDYVKLRKKLTPEFCQKTFFGEQYNKPSSKNILQHESKNLIDEFLTSFTNNDSSTDQEQVEILLSVLENDPNKNNKNYRQYNSFDNESQLDIIEVIASKIESTYDFFGLDYRQNTFNRLSDLYKNNVSYGTPKLAFSSINPKLLKLEQSLAREKFLGQYDSIEKIKNIDLSSAEKIEEAFQHMDHLSENKAKELLIHKLWNSKEKFPYEGYFKILSEKIDSLKTKNESTDKLAKMIEEKMRCLEDVSWEESKIEEYQASFFDGVSVLDFNNLRPKRTMELLRKFKVKYQLNNTTNPTVLKLTATILSLLLKNDPNKNNANYRSKNAFHKDSRKSLEIEIKSITRKLSLTTAEKEFFASILPDFSDLDTTWADRNG